MTIRAEQHEQRPGLDLHSMRREEHVPQLQACGAMPNEPCVGSLLTFPGRLENTFDIGKVKVKANLDTNMVSISKAAADAFVLSTQRTHYVRVLSQVCWSIAACSPADGLSSYLGCHANSCPRALMAH